MDQLVYNFNFTEIVIFILVINIKMSECNCTIPYYYEYSEYKIKSQKFSKLNDDDFAIKIVFDLLDKDYNIIKDNELVYSSVFEKIGIDTYNVITQITQHKSPELITIPKKGISKSVNVLSNSISTQSSTQHTKKPVIVEDILLAKQNPISIVSNEKITAPLIRTSSCDKIANPCLTTSDSGPKSNDTMTTKKFSNDIRAPPFDFAVTKRFSGIYTR